MYGQQLKPKRTWRMWLVAPMAVFVILSVGVAYNERNGLTSSPPTTGGTTKAEISRMSNANVRADRMDQAFLDEFSNAAAADLSSKAKTPVTGEGTFQQINGHRIAVVRLNFSGASPAIVFAMVRDGEIITVMCYSDHKIVLQVTDPVCVEKTNEAFGSAPAPTMPSASPTPSLPEMDTSANPSAFNKTELPGGISIALPRDWRWMDRADVSALNTNAEAGADAVGLDANQGNNTILIAGNAFNDAKQSVATVRVSVRSSADMSQADLRAGLKEPKAESDATMMQAAEIIAGGMRKAPGMLYYKVTSATLEQNVSLICLRTSFEYDQGRGAVVSDTWVCPLGNRTVKLSTSYHKDRANLFAQTIAYVWRSLAVSNN
jgi:hypothetical protein